MALNHSLSLFQFDSTFWVCTYTCKWVNKVCGVVYNSILITEYIYSIVSSPHIRMYCWTHQHLLPRLLQFYLELLARNYRQVYGTNQQFLLPTLFELVLCHDSSCTCAKQKFRLLELFFHDYKGLIGQAISSSLKILIILLWKWKLVTLTFKIQYSFYRWAWYPTWPDIHQCILLYHTNHL